MKLWNCASLLKLLEARRRSLRPQQSDTITPPQCPAYEMYVSAPFRSRQQTNVRHKSLEATGIPTAAFVR
jgi:hypothetical protein